MMSSSTGTEDKGSLREIKAESSLTARVRESIRQAIIDGSLEPGSLHSVKSLADIFKVSRTPVREALIDLAGADMVEFERNRGVRILETSVHDLEEILVLRILLEVPATHRAAQRIDAAGLEELRQEMDAMVEASEEGDEPTLMQHDRRNPQARWGRPPDQHRLGQHPPDRVRRFAARPDPDPWRLHGRQHPLAFRDRRRARSDRRGARLG